jgi:hypothetical protein
VHYVTTYTYKAINACRTTSLSKGLLNVVLERVSNIDNTKTPIIPQKATSR